jgi:uncharacterized membrane protein YkoI
VTGTQLADEQGYVVYDVTVAGKDGQTHDVTVDAGNGTVLHQGMAGDNDADGDG